jgi:hypothetical protein
MLNYQSHLISFFHFYQNFDFANNVICPFLGREVPIKTFTNDNESFKKFQGNLKGFNFQVVNVADLFNLNFNVGYGVGKKRIAKFVPFCGHAIEILRDHFNYSDKEMDGLIKKFAEQIRVSQKTSIV